MHAVSRKCWPIVCALVLLSSRDGKADLIFLKDGHVVQGAVRREGKAELDHASKEMVFIPKGFFSIDDGPRRTYFSPSQVRIVEKLAIPTETRVVSKSGRLILAPRILPPIAEVVETGEWNEKRWEREYFFRTPAGDRIGLIQGIAALSPHYAQVDAVTKFRWGAAYLTREWDAETVIKLLRTHPAFQDNLKDDKPGQAAARRMSLCDFLAQAGWFDHADKELDRLVADHPDQKDRIRSAREMVVKLRIREDWEQIKNWFQAGRHDAVRKRLADFPTTNVPDRILADVREMKGRLVASANLVDQASRALEETSREVKTANGRALTSAVKVIRTELHAATVERLDAFLGQVREAARQKEQKKKPTLGPDELLALAVSGWLLGSPSAEARPEHAINLWKTRQMILEYQGESDALTRRKILTEYQARVTPRVDLDEVAQVIPSLPPITPADNLSTQTLELQAGTGRRKQSYLLRLPPEYTHNRPYPLLLVLHNTGEKASRMLARWEKVASDHGYVLAAPEWSKGLSDEYGYTEREHDAVLDTLRDLRRRYRIDCDRVFLHGWGEGGKMAFDVGLAHPDLFAGVLPMSAGPTKYPRRYWRNAQYLPFYVVNGTRGNDTQALLREQFESWVLRGFAALWIEYKGRGTEFFTGEVPVMLDWMRHQRRHFPLRQLGTDGVGTQFGTEFCTMRQEDNRFYWLSTTNISNRCIVDPEGRWNGLTQPAAMTGRIDATTNEVTLKAQGLLQLTIWLGRSPGGQYMIDFEKPVHVRVGLRTFWNRKVIPDLGVLLEDLYKRGDRMHLYLAKIDLNLR